MIKKVALFEIALILASIFSFAYLIGEVHGSYHVPNQGDNESKFMLKMRGLLLDYLSRGIVSAQESLWTCPQNLNGTICQEYPSSICDDICGEECFPGAAEDLAECNLGTCFDSSQGTCLPNTPQTSCIETGGQWSDASEGVPAQCNRGCCLINDEASFVTETTCNVLSERVGAELDGVDNRFDSEIKNELACLALAEEQEQGACVLNEVSEIGERDCSFTSRSGCNVLGGEFNAGLLCSNSELNTVCERQHEVKCSLDKDEVYWHDSCGNQENIYDSNKARSWNDGKVLPKSESCQLSSGNDPLGNQERCGNCNYFLGSVCGIPGETDETIVDSALGNFVCQDLSCEDEHGNLRKNGESWCSFESQIGVDNEDQPNTERSVDVPGSSHYRRICLDGEVRTESCGEFRNEICVESRDERADFSSSACRINQWQQCIAANSDQEKLNNCEEHTDCSLHSIDIDKFEFDVCTPKYPPGFNLKTNFGGQAGENVCSAASQTCTVIEVKKLTGWKCEANCECLSAGFTETMNNLCVSLGDCGAHVNVEGDFSDEGYSVTEAPELDSSYASQLRKYANPVEGQKVEPLSREELAALYGIPEIDFENNADLADFLGKVGLGATGGLVVAGHAAGIFTFKGILAEGGISNLLGTQVSFAGSSSLAAFGNVAASAAVGAAVGFVVAQIAGLEGEAANIVVLGTAIATALDTGIALALGKVLTIGTVLGTAIIAAIAFAAIASLLGLGDTREIEVSFSCLPWQPPKGGDSCNACNNENELGCTRYQCQSLGQNCELINEGTSEQACVDTSPNDVSPPIISEDSEVVSDDLGYGEITDRGFVLESDLTGDGCIREFTPIEFGIETDEPAQCKIESVHTTDYDQMSKFFGGNNLYKTKHEALEVVPSLSSLGVSGVGSDPDRRGEYNLFVRCSDTSGNANIEEYVVSMCVSPAQDFTPPIIEEFIPEDPGYVAFSTQTGDDKFVQFYTNEPAECRWDLTDKSYEEMGNLAVCSNDIDSATSRGWLCSASLPVQIDSEVDYYFRCEDQPWLSEDDDETNDNKRNSNAESVSYRLIKTTEELLISSITPEKDETVFAAGEPVSVELEIQTQGGVDDSALCEFNFDPGSDFYIDFFETNSAIHKQKFTSLFEGNYDLGLRCTDIAGNVAEESTSFSVSVDSSGPKVTRIYNQAGELVIITNEDAMCSVSFDSCGFSFNEGELMSTDSSGLRHEISLEEGETYHVKCQDEFENVGNCVRIAAGY